MEKKDPSSTPEPLAWLKQLSLGDPQELAPYTLYPLCVGEAGPEPDLLLTHFASLSRVLRSVVDALPSLPDSASPAIVQRLGELAWRAESVGWGYGDAVREITLPAISPSPERRPQRRARRS